MPQVYTGEMKGILKCKAIHAYSVHLVLQNDSKEIRRFFADHGYARVDLLLVLNLGILKGHWEADVQIKSISTFFDIFL